MVPSGFVSQPPTCGCYKIHAEGLQHLEYLLARHPGLWYGPVLLSGFEAPSPGTRRDRGEGERFAVAGEWGFGSRTVVADAVTAKPGSASALLVVF